MIPILYESNETTFTSNGIGRLRDCITCKVTEERNGIYECDFEYPIDGAHFDDIICGRIIAVRHDDSADVEPFDIVSYSAPIGGVVTFHAVHISYRLSYSTAWATNVNSLSAALSVLNSIGGSPFTFEADFTSTAYMGAFDGVPRTARQLMGGIEGSILDSYGGEYEFDNFRVILHKSRGIERDFTIRYGVNMLDYQEDTDYQGTYTSCVPYWMGQDALGRDSIVRGARVDSGLPTITGRRETIPLDLTEKFESKPTAAQLESMAASLMQSKQVNLPAQTIKVDFIRLQDFEEFADFESLLQCNLCDRIKVVFPRYNMSGSYKIVRTVWDVLEGRYTEMELGALSTSLADALGINQGTTAKDSPIDDLAINGDLSVVGSATIGGNLTAGGHSSPIGTRLTGERESTAGTATTSYTTAAHIDLTAGTWVITGYNSFNGGTAGRRAILITGSSTATYDAAEGSASGYAAASMHVALSTAITVSITSNATYYLRIKSASQVDSPIGNLAAVRIS